MKLHKLLFLLFLFLIPIQTRVLYFADKAYVSWFFNYHEAFFLYLTDLVLFLCFISWIFFDRPLLASFLKSRLFLLNISFIVAVILTMFHVKRIDLAWYQWLKWLEFLFLLIYIQHQFKTLESFSMSSLILFVSAGLQGLLAWIQFHMQHMVGLRLFGEYIAPLGTPGLATITFGTQKFIRGYGTFPQPNVLGAFLVLGLVMGFYNVSRVTNRSKIAILVGLAIIFMGIFSTFSRLAWVMAIIVTVSFFVYYLWIKQKTLAISLFIPVILCIAAILFFYKPYLNARINNSDSSSINDRLFFDQLGLNLFHKFPVLGVGVGNYVEALKDRYSLQPWQYQPAHNIFIFLAAESGIVGLGLFIALLIEVFSGLKKTNWELLPFSLALLGIVFLLMSQFDHYFVTIQQGRLMFAAALGLIAALPNLYDHKKIS